MGGRGTSSIGRNTSNSRSADADKGGAEALVTQAGPWEKSLTAEEKSAIVAYAKSPSVNYLLRLTKPPFGQTSIPGPADIPGVSALDSAISKSTLPKAVTVYREVDSRYSSLVGGVDNPAGLKGTVLTNKGFSSTSLDPNFSINGGRTGAAYVLKFRVPAGAHGAYIDPVSGQGEKELLLPRGVSLRVTGVQGNTKTNAGQTRYVITADYIKPA